MRTYIQRACRKVTLLALLYTYCSTATAQTYQCIACKDINAIQSLKPYAAFTHQHQDFFGKAFSFQNIETGIRLNNTLHIGLYGGIFASNLQAKVHTQYRYVTACQAGITFNKVFNPNKLLHTGYGVSAGYFRFITGEGKLSPFQNIDTGAVNGLILSPQVFAELNITRWLSFRPGLSYNFYSVENNAEVTAGDISNIALNFGFYFHGVPSNTNRQVDIK